jgi:hypothetical protein
MTLLLNDSMYLDMLTAGLLKHIFLYIHLQVRKALGEKVIEHDNSPAIHLGNRTKTL